MKIQHTDFKIHKDLSRHIAKEDIQMTNRCITSIMNGMKIKSTRCYFIFVWKTTVKKEGVSKDVKK